MVETNARALIEMLRAIPKRRHLCMEEGTRSRRGSTRGEDIFCLDTRVVVRTYLIIELSPLGEVIACRSECPCAVVKTIDVPVRPIVASRISVRLKAGRPGAQWTRSVEWRRAARMVWRIGGPITAVAGKSGGLPPSFSPTACLPLWGQRGCFDRRG